MSKAVRSVHFDTPPLVGFAITVGMARQRFEVVGSEPYTRVDGTETTLLLWTSPCADCGALFITKSASTGISKAFANRRCEAHRKPLKRVKAARP